MPIPLWLILFVVAGFLLFFFKISGERAGGGKTSGLRLFLLLTFVLFSLAGIAAFVKWASGIE